MIVPGYDFELYKGLREAHAALLQLDEEHEGSAHCPCPIARLLRAYINQHFDQIWRDERRERSHRAHAHLQVLRPDRDVQ